MNRDIIERLAVDHAAGELSDDARALFETYIAEHPEQNQWAQQMLHTYAATERTFRAKARPPQRDIAAVPIHSRTRPRVPIAPVVRWAAVIAIVFTLGAGLGRLSKPVAPTRVERIVTPQAASVGSLRALLSASAGGFWHDRAVSLIQEKQTHPKVPPRSGGGLWQTYRQYVRENRYE